MCNFKLIKKAELHIKTHSYIPLILIFFCCFFVLGWPLPELTWYTESSDDSTAKVENMVDSSYRVRSEVSNDVVGAGSPTEKVLRTENSILIPVLTRDYFGKSYRCDAENNNVTAPASTNITIDMTCK